MTVSSGVQGVLEITEIKKYEKVVTIRGDITYFVILELFAFYKGIYIYKDTWLY